MHTLVIVGGLDRSGTTGSCLYVHLNDKAYTYMTGLCGAEILDATNYTTDTDWVLRNDLADPNCSRTPTAQRFLSKEDMESCIKDKESLTIYQYLEDKNELENRNLDSYTHICSRNNRFEVSRSYEDYQQMLESFHVKFIYPMRKDISAMWYSQRNEHGLRHPREEFVRRTMESYDTICKLKSNGLDICAIDITEPSTRQADLQRLDDFLGLPPSDHQRYFTSNDLVVNHKHKSADPHLERLNKKDFWSFPDLEKTYKSVRKELVNDF